jgi:hypothetical protein
MSISGCVSTLIENEAGPRQSGDKVERRRYISLDIDRSRWMALSAAAARPAAFLLAF